MKMKELVSEIIESRKEELIQEQIDSGEFKSEISSSYDALFSDLNVSYVNYIKNEIKEKNTDLLDDYEASK